MKLPTVSSPTIVTFKYKGADIKFRKLTTFELLELAEMDGSRMELIVNKLADLLHGYDENTLEEKIGFIKSLDLEDLDEISKLLEMVGLNTTSKKKVGERSESMIQSDGSAT